MLPCHIATTGQQQMRPAQMTTTDVHQRMDGSCLHQPGDVLQVSFCWLQDVSRCLKMSQDVSRRFTTQKCTRTSLTFWWCFSSPWNDRNPRSSKGIPVARTLIFACILSFRRGETKLKSLNCDGMSVESAESAMLSHIYIYIYSIYVVSICYIYIYMYMYIYIYIPAHGL